MVRLNVSKKAEKNVHYDRNIIGVDIAKAYFFIIIIMKQITALSFLYNLFIFQ